MSLCHWELPQCVTNPGAQGNPRRHAGHGKSAGEGMLQPEAIVCRLWTGVTSATHGFGALAGYG